MTTSTAVPLANKSSPDLWSGMIAWRGAGILVFLFGAIAFFGVVMGFDGPAKGTLYPWGLALLGLGAISLPVGWVLNRRRPRDSTHDFMFIPMQYWGGLFLIAGVGMLGAHFAMSDGGDTTGQGPCADLSALMSTCRDPGASMLAIMCTQLPPDTQASCLSCVQSSADPCSPGACRSACLPNR